MLTSPRNFLVSNVELNWARLDQPVSPFGAAQWELQIATTDKAVADDLKANHMNVKERDGKFVVALKRKAVKADGSPMDPVRVVDAAKAPIMDRRSIGNGSIGNVIVWQAPYEVQGRKGISNSLTAVQVTTLEVYSGGSNNVDFDIVGEDAPAGTDAASLF